MGRIPPRPFPMHRTRRPFAAQHGPPARPSPSFPLPFPPTIGSRSDGPRAHTPLNRPWPPDANRTARGHLLPPAVFLIRSTGPATIFGAWELHDGLQPLPFLPLVRAHDSHARTALTPRSSPLPARPFARAPNRGRHDPARLVLLPRPCPRPISRSSGTASLFSPQIHHPLPL